MNLFVKRTVATLVLAAQAVGMGAAAQAAGVNAGAASQAVSAGAVVQAAVNLYDQDPIVIPPDADLDALWAAHVYGKPDSESTRAWADALLKEALRREQEQQQQAEEEARRQAEEEARRQAEAQRQAEEEARRQAEAEAQRRAEEEARRQAEEEARRQQAIEIASQAVNINPGPVEITAPGAETTPPANVGVVEAPQPADIKLCAPDDPPVMSGVTPEKDKELVDRAKELAEQELLNRLIAQQNARNAHQNQATAAQSSQNKQNQQTPYADATFTATEEQAQRVDEFLEAHPHGSKWDNSNHYGSYVACAAFAIEAQQCAFGEDADYVMSKDPQDLRQFSAVQVQLTGGLHWIFIMSVNEDGTVTIAEGNVNGKVVIGTTCYLDPDMIVVMWNPA